MRSVPDSGVNGRPQEQRRANHIESVRLWSQDTRPLCVSNPAMTVGWNYRMLATDEVPRWVRGDSTMSPEIGTRKARRGAEGISNRIAQWHV